jgi:adenylate kinase
MTRVIALTGTPGTGKTELAEHLERNGAATVELADLARRSGAVVGRDEGRLTDEVDVDILRRAAEGLLADLPSDVLVVLVGHMAHLMPCELVIVLRTSPGVLRERLAARGWPESKVSENVEAEAVGVILVESMEIEPPVPVYEIDTTEDPVETSVDRFEGTVAGDPLGLEAGWVDWSEEVLGWF